MDKEKMDFIEAIVKSKSTKDVNLAKMASIIYDLVELKSSGVKPVEKRGGDDIGTFKDHLKKIMEDVESMQESVDAFDIKVESVEKKIDALKDAAVKNSKTTAKKGVKLKQAQ